MGNTPSYSQWHQRNNDPRDCQTHLTLFTPIFGRSDHVESFILSAMLPYPQDPIFGAFILAPFFQQIPSQLTNDDFLEQYKIDPELYRSNYEKSDTIDINLLQHQQPHQNHHQLQPRRMNMFQKILNPKLSPLNPPLKILPHGSQPSLDSLVGNHWRPQKIEFDTNIFPIFPTHSPYPNIPSDLISTHPTITSDIMLTSTIPTNSNQTNHPNHPHPIEHPTDQTNQPIEHSVVPTTDPLINPPIPPTVDPPIDPMADLQIDPTQSTQPQSQIFQISTTTSPLAHPLKTTTLIPPSPLKPTTLPSVPRNSHSSHSTAPSQPHSTPRLPPHSHHSPPHSHHHFTTSIVLPQYPSHVPFLKIGLPIVQEKPIEKVNSPDIARVARIPQNITEKNELLKILPFRSIGRYGDWGEDNIEKFYKNYNTGTEQKLYQDYNTIEQLSSSLVVEDQFSHKNDEECKNEKNATEKNNILIKKFQNEINNYHKTVEKENKKKYKFNTIIPYNGLGGDGIRTEYDIYSKWSYPRPSLVSVRSIIGYDFEILAKIPHISTIPAHHLATILILDVISLSSRVVLSDFITQTLMLLQRGCIIPLINVDIFILELNAEKLEQKILENSEIIKKLTQIGFNIDKIHITSSQIHELYIPNKLTPYNINRGIFEVFPIVEKDALTWFLTPIWDLIYEKVFLLHNKGHWDRLVSESTKNPFIHLIPSHIYPICITSMSNTLGQKKIPYLNLMNLEFFQKNIKQIFGQKGEGKKNQKIKKFKFKHNDFEEIFSFLMWKSLYKYFYDKAKDYLYPNYSIINDNNQENLNPYINHSNNPSNLNPYTNHSNNPSNLLHTHSNQGNPSNLHNIHSNHPSNQEEDLNDLYNQTSYNILFNQKEQNWNLPKNNFPNLFLNNFILNPTPVQFSPYFNLFQQNNGRSLPLKYLPSFPKFIYSSENIKNPNQRQNNQNSNQYHQNYHHHDDDAKNFTLSTEITSSFPFDIEINDDTSSFHSFSSSFSFQRPPLPPHPPLHHDPINSINFYEADRLVKSRLIFPIIAKTLSKPSQPSPLPSLSPHLPSPRVSNETRYWCKDLDHCDLHYISSHHDHDNHSTNSPDDSNTLHDYDIYSTNSHHICNPNIPHCHHPHHHHHHHHHLETTLEIPESISTPSHQHDLHDSHLSHSTEDVHFCNDHDHHYYHNAQNSYSHDHHHHNAHNQYCNRCSHDERHHQVSQNNKNITQQSAIDDIDLANLNDETAKYTGLSRTENHKNHTSTSNVNQNAENTANVPHNTFEKKPITRTSRSNTNDHNHPHRSHRHHPHNQNNNPLGLNLNTDNNNNNNNNNHNTGQCDLNLDQTQKIHTRHSRSRTGDHHSLNNFTKNFNIGNDNPNLFPDHDDKHGDDHRYNRSRHQNHPQNQVESSIDQHNDHKTQFPSLTDHDHDGKSTPSSLSHCPIDQNYDQKTSTPFSALSPPNIPIDPDQELINSIIALGLPRNYEFEAFIMWSIGPAIADPQHIMKHGHYYEPHVQYEIIKAVENIKKTHKNECIDQYLNKIPSSSLVLQTQKEQSPIQLQTKTASSPTPTSTPTPKDILDVLIPSSHRTPISSLSPLNYLHISLPHIFITSLFNIRPKFAIKQRQILNFYPHDIIEEIGGRLQYAVMRKYQKYICNHPLSDYKVHYRSPRGGMQSYIRATTITTTTTKKVNSNNTTAIPRSYHPAMTNTNLLLQKTLRKKAKHEPAQSSLQGGGFKFPKFIKKIHGPNANGLTQAHSRVKFQFGKGIGNICYCIEGDLKIRQRSRLALPSSSLSSPKNPKLHGTTGFDSASQLMNQFLDDSYGINHFSKDNQGIDSFSDENYHQHKINFSDENNHHKINYFSRANCHRINYFPDNYSHLMNYFLDDSHEINHFSGDHSHGMNSPSNYDHFSDDIHFSEDYDNHFPDDNHFIDDNGHQISHHPDDSSYHSTHDNSDGDSDDDSLHSDIYDDHHHHQHHHRHHHTQNIPNTKTPTDENHIILQPQKNHQTIDNFSFSNRHPTQNKPHSTLSNQANHYNQKDDYFHTHDTSPFHQKHDHDHHQNHGHHHQKPTISIAITYLNRPTNSATLSSPHSTQHFFYPTHPLNNSISFIPMAWLYGIFITPFVYINSRTKFIKNEFFNFGKRLDPIGHKKNDFYTKQYEKQVYIDDRPFGEYLWKKDIGNGDKIEIVKENETEIGKFSPLIHSAADPTPSIPAIIPHFRPSFDYYANPIEPNPELYPPDFIPPPIPPFPSPLGKWKNALEQGIVQNKFAKEYLKMFNPSSSSSSLSSKSKSTSFLSSLFSCFTDNNSSSNKDMSENQQNNQKNNENQQNNNQNSDHPHHQKNNNNNNKLYDIHFPFSLPLPLCYIDQKSHILPDYSEYNLLDPANRLLPSLTTLAHYNCPITFIILIINPIHPNPVPNKCLDADHIHTDPISDIHPHDNQDDDDRDDFKTQNTSNYDNPMGDGLSMVNIPTENGIKDTKGNKIWNHGNYQNIALTNSINTTQNTTATTTTTTIAATTVTTIATPAAATTSTTGSSTTPFPRPIPNQTTKLPKIPHKIVKPTLSSSQKQKTDKFIENTFFKDCIKNSDNILEPITQLQYRYYQDYIPLLYKRQLTEIIFGYGPYGGTTEKLQNLWSVEVHTPQSLTKAYKRIEYNAVKIRLNIFRNLIQQQQQQGE